MINEVPCKHHWILGIPDGPVSNGMCKLCGETRDFLNAFVEGMWKKDRSPTTRTLSPDEIGLELVG